MSQCPHMQACPIFPLFTLRTSLRIWQTNYCESDYERCARFQRAAQGKITPMNLLPNGETLAVGGKASGA